MRTKTELQQDILNIAMKIQMEFPELTKHIKEMPSLFLSKELDHKHTETLELYYTKLKSALVEYSRRPFGLEPNEGTETINFIRNTNPLFSQETHTYGKVEMQLIPIDHSTNQNRIEDIVSSDEKDFRII